MAFCHNTERRNLRDSGEGSQPQGGEKAAPPLRGAPRGTFCGVPSSRSCPAPSRHHRFPFGDLATAPQHAHGPLWDHPCPQGSPSGGAPDRGWGSLEVSSKMSSGNPAPGPGWGADPGRAELLIGIPRTRAGVQRSACQAGSCDSTTRARLRPGPHSGGLRGPPRARSALHAGETDEKIKNPL